MKILCFVDRHYTEKQPVSRVDDFIETGFKKDKEILQIAKENNVDLILHTGDFFDKPNVSDEFFKKVLSYWSNNVQVNDLLDEMNETSQIEELKNKLENLNSIPMASIIGNHDVPGGNIELVDNTKLGLMDYLGVNKLFSKEKPYFFTNNDGSTVAITGTSYHSGIDKKENIEKDYIVNKKLADFHIHVVHGMLTDKTNVSNIFRQTSIDEIKETKADITISGHDHNGFGVQEIDGKFFLNPGSVVRLTAGEVDRDNVYVALIDIDKSGTNVELIPLKSAKKASTVISREHIERANEKTVKAEEYEAEVRNFKLNKRADIYETLEEVAKNNNVDDKYKNDLIDRTSKKEKEINKNIAAPKDEVYIETMYIENFQSHKDSVFHFSNGLNVLIGESSNGKTSVIRALRYVYENRPRGRDFIRVNEDYAKVTLKLSNGYTVSRMTERKAHGFNGYIIEDPNGQIEKGNTLLLPEVQKILGFSDFIIDDDLVVPLNFMFQGDSWFLIGDKYTSTDRAKIIGAVKGTHYIDAVKRELDRENSKTLSEIKTSKENKDRLLEDLKEYEYLDDVEEMLVLTKDKMIEIKEKKELLDKLSETYDEYKDIQKEIKEDDLIIQSTEIKKDVIDKLNSLKLTMNELILIEAHFKNHTEIKKEIELMDEQISGTSNIEKLNKLIFNIYEHLTQFNDLIKVKDEYFDIEKKIVNASVYINESNGINIAKDKLDRLKDNANNLVLINNGLSQYKSVNKEYLSSVSLINETSKVENISIKLLKLKEQIDEVNKLQLVSKDIKIINKSINDEINVINQQDEVINVEANNLSEILEEAEVCPVCNTHLTKDKIKDIINKGEDINE